MDRIEFELTFGAEQPVEPISEPISAAGQQQAGKGKKTAKQQGQRRQAKRQQQQQRPQEKQHLASEQLPSKVQQKEDERKQGDHKPKGGASNRQRTTAPLKDGQVNSSEDRKRDESSQEMMRADDHSMLRFLEDKEHTEQEFNMDREMERDLLEQEQEPDLRISQVNEEIADRKIRGLRGLDLLGVNESKLVDFHKRKADLYSEVKEPTVMKDAFKVTESGEVFSDTKITNMSDVLHQALIKNLTQFMNLEKQTVIQAKAFNHIVAGKDVLIASETGSGKTLSYLVPLLQRIINFCFDESERRITRQDGTFAIIMGPTRELCMQIYKVLHKLCNPFPWLVPGLLIGGEKTKSEKSRLRKGVTVLVATPGRLNYHLKNTSNFVLDNLMSIVLDEADGIMDLGDEEQVKSIFMNVGSKIKRDSKPQAVLVSATLNSNIKRLANFTLSNEVYVGYEENQQEQLSSQSTSTEVFRIPASLQQYYLISPRYLFFPLLIALIRSKTSQISLSLAQNQKPAKMLVFLGTADGVEFYHYSFSKAPLFKNESENGLAFSVPLFKLHSDMQTEERTKSFLEFSQAESGVMFTTDVAARGLDFPGVDWIIQYDPPGEPKEYLHRIGRTARLGRVGHAVMFLSDSEILYLKLLEKFNLHPQRLNGLSLLEHLNLAFGSSVAKSATSAVRHLFNIFAVFLKKNKDAYQWGCAAFLSFLRGYTSYYRDTRYIFHAKNLRMDHVKRMYGLTEKGRVLMKSKPEVGRIKVKLHERQEKKSDLHSELKSERRKGPRESDTFIIDKMPLANADEEIIESDDEELRDDQNFSPSLAIGEQKPEPKGMDIREFLEDYRDSLENPTPSKPLVNIDPSLQPEQVQQEKKRMEELSKPHKSLKRDTPFGGTSRHMRMRLLGQTKKDSIKDVRKKEKFKKRLHDEIVVGGRTRDPKRLAERNPFDVRGRGAIAKITNSLSSEFASGVAAVSPAKRRRMTS